MSVRRCSFGSRNISELSITGLQCESVAEHYTLRFPRKKSCKWKQPASGSLWSNRRTLIQAPVYNLSVLRGCKTTHRLIRQIPFLLKVCFVRKYILLEHIECWKIIFLYYPLDMSTVIANRVRKRGGNVYNNQSFAVLAKQF